MAFHEIRFPVEIARGARGGPERRTQIVTTASGHEERNQLWVNSRRRYDAGYGIRSRNDIDSILSFFEERRGRFHGFRFRDRADFKSCVPDDDIAPTDQALATGDGAVTSFQLVKQYGSAFAPWTRDIVKPVDGTVVIALDGVAQGPGWSVDVATGIVSFDVAPGSGVAVTAGFEFDVPVRFDADFLEIDLATFKAGAIPSSPLIEVRT